MDGMRLDKWLWFARFCKSRSLAQALLDDGGALLNDRPVAKTSAAVRPGDQVTVRQGRAWRRVQVIALGTRRGPSPEAGALYRELAKPLPGPDPWGPPLPAEAATADRHSEKKPKALTEGGVVPGDGLC